MLFLRTTLVFLVCNKSTLHTKTINKMQHQNLIKFKIYTVSSMTYLHRTKKYIYNSSSNNNNNNNNNNFIL